MNADLIKRIARAYQLDYRAILEPQKGYRNQSWPIIAKNGEWLNLIVYKNESHIVQKVKNANTVSDFLAAKGFPTRQTRGTIMRLSSPRATKYACLYTYLPGSTIPWEAYTMKHIKHLGAAMSSLHAALRGCDHVLPDVTNEYQDLLAQMSRYFADPAVGDALHEKLGVRLDLIKLDEFSSLLTHCATLPNQQPLHMDFVRGNILFSSADITGILDFEKTARGHRLFDIARTLAFLLVDCKYKSEPQVRKYFLYSGYTKRGTLPFADITANGQSTLESLLDLFLTYDFYKFLRHNPYEYLPRNEHFVRTSRLLAERGIIAYNKIYEKVGFVV